jgi:hypothetical protein
MASIKKQKGKQQLHVILCSENRREMEGRLTDATAMKIMQLGCELVELAGFTRIREIVRI